MSLAIRRLWREPRFTASVVLTLAIGLGANLTVFTFVDAFLLAPLPVPGADALLRVGEDRGGAESDLVSYLNFSDGRAGAAGTLDLAAHNQTMAMVGPAASAEVRPVELVSGNYFRVMQLVPQLGRLLSESDETAELAHPLAVVSDTYWRTRLGQRPGVLGQSVFINGAPFEIIGVAPPGFGGTYAAHHIDLWVPVTMQQVVRPRNLTLERRGWGWLRMIGRPRAEASQVEAERALALAADDVNRRFPPRAGATPFGFVVRPATALSEVDSRELSPMLWTALAFTGLLFLATCANLAGLMHGRLALRRRELAIRQSLGAGRGRLVGDWMLECIVLAVGGGLAALLVARLTAGALSSIEIPLQMLGGLSFDTTLQWRVVLYTFGVSVAGAGLFGATSAWRAGRLVPVEALKAESGTSTGGPNAARARRAMVIVQVGASVVLLMLASLLTQSLRWQRTATPGFDAAGIGLLSLDLLRQRVPVDQWPALTQRAVDLARTTPGVRDADIGLRSPLTPGEDVILVRIPGYDPRHEQNGLDIDFNVVGPEYFSTLGVPFERGGPWDGRSPASTAVINHTMAERYWPGSIRSAGRC
jgi:predicted permease